MAHGLPTVLPGGAQHVHSRIEAQLAAGGRSVSFEFFPPKDAAGEEVLLAAVRRLEPLAPTFVSVTYGAGGSSRDGTVRAVGRIVAETTLTPVGHLTCVGAGRAELRQVVGQYADAGVANVMALRGDPPGGPGSPWTPHPGGVDSAVDLVAMLRDLGRFSVGVAAFPQGHPESPDAEHDARVLALKQQAGASFAITQFVFDPADYLRMRDVAARHGADLPIVPGLMPVTNVAQIERFAAMSGAPLPDAVVARLRAVADDPVAVRAVGVDIATEVGQALLDEDAPGLHFYTLNRSTATLQIAERLGLRAGVTPVAGR